MGLTLRVSSCSAIGSMDGDGEMKNEGADLQKIADELYAALAGPDGLNCSGPCRVDGTCVCSPAYAAIAALEKIAKEKESK